MRKFFVIFIILIVLSTYFALTVFVLPERYLAKERLVPMPYVEAELSDTNINLGESVTLDIFSENKGEHGDIHIVSVAFPNIKDIKNIIKITSYDFTQSPKYLKPGDKIGARYSVGTSKIMAAYPSIEAMNRPIHAGAKNMMSLMITPDRAGIFTIYVKTVDIPHSSSLSHYPYSGKLDQQEEYVLVYSINVNP